MAQFFIHRPVFAWVVSILIVFVGLIALRFASIEQYPNVAPPTIAIIANYPGANAEEIAQSVTSVIEDELNGVDNLLYYSSNSTNTGQLRINVSFEPGTDPDIAQMQVQNSVQSITSRLPQSVIDQGIRYKKSNEGGRLMFISLQSKSGKLSQTDLADYIVRNIQNDISRIDGVGEFDLYASERAVRIWLDNNKMISLGVTATEINQALRAQNVLIPGGTLGAPPAPDSVTSTMVLSVNGQLKSPEDFSKVVIKFQPDGSIVHLSDVAQVEMGQKNYQFSSQVNGQPAAMIAITLKTGANAISTEQAILDKMEEVSRYFPDDITYSIPYDTVPYVQQSIDQLLHTLFEAVVLVFLVMFLFLQNFRYTIIPAIVVPVALLGTVAALQFFGYSINTLTMFAMVLAIGILVDDAIVVVENIERLMAEEGLSPLQATIKGMPQIQGAIIGITAVLIVVFMPLLFLSGSAGVIYRHFAMAIMISIAFSAFLALSLTPALCATIIKPLKDNHHDKKGFFGWFNRNFEKLTHRYMAGVARVIKYSWLMLLCYGLLIATTVMLVLRMPSSFLPVEDQGYTVTNVILPSGASANRTDAVLKQVQDYFHQEPIVKNTLSVRGFSFNGAGYNAGMVFAMLQDFKDRKGRQNSANAISGKATGALMFGIPDATIFSVVPPAIATLGNASGFDLRLQDRGSLGIAKLREQANLLVKEANASGIIQNARVNGMKEAPSYRVIIDRDKAARHGVNMAEVAQVIASSLGGGYVNKFPNMGRMQEVWLQLKPEDRVTAESLLSLRVPSHLPASAAGGANVQAAGTPSGAGADGDTKFVELRSFTTLEPFAQQNVVDRFNSYYSITIQGAPAPGYANGDAMAELKRIISTELAQDVGYEWAGLSYQEIQAGNQAPIMMGLAIIVVFLLLAALYESWSIPFAAIMIIPLGMFGTVLLSVLRNMANDIYFQLGMITVIGLATKNAILIVEFAKDEVAQGKALLDATIDAARIRFRPILMTSFAFILGVVPLLFASAAGAAGQQVVGTAVIGGMIGATIFSVFFVPVFFYSVLKLFKTKPKLLGAQAQQSEFYAESSRRMDGSAGSADSAADSRQTKHPENGRSESNHKDS